MTLFSVAPCDLSSSLESRWKRRKRLGGFAKNFPSFVIFVLKSDGETNISHFVLSTITLFSSRVFLFYFLTNKTRTFIPTGRDSWDQQTDERWRRAEGREDEKPGKEEKKKIERWKRRKERRRWTSSRRGGFPWKLVRREGASSLFV